MSSAAQYELVAIEKLASVNYLEEIFHCYASGRIAVPVDASGAAPAGHEFAERVPVRSGGGWFIANQAPIIDDRPAQISFSSGTTGMPKAILLSHRALADVTSRLVAVMGMDSEIAEYLGVPPTYSFGLGRARAVAAVGGRLYVPPRGFDPVEFARMLGDGSVNAFSAVPTILRVLIANRELIPADAGQRLRWLEIGSQPMSAADKRTVCEIFPNARIIQHYGLTEASRTTFLDLHESSPDHLASVGKAIGDTEIRIGDDGRIHIRGPHVADGLLTPHGLEPLTDAEGWLRTSDLGRIDGDGYLYFLGRADHVLNVGGIKVSAELFEERLAIELGKASAGVAVAGMADAMRGQVVGIAHLPAVLRDSVAGGVKKIAPEFGIHLPDVRIVELESIPRTETGKVQRGLLSSLLDGKGEATTIAAADPPETGHSEHEGQILRIWREALGIAEIGRDDSLFDVGGDSLSAINVMLKMERAGIAPEITQQIFEGRTVAEIAARLDGRDAGAPAVNRVETSDAINLTRALMVAVVIGGHWLPFVLVRTGEWAELLVRWSNPIFRFGTPGFAMMYGLGLTFFNMALLRKNPDRLKSNLRTNMTIVAGGVLTLAVFRAVDHQIEGNTITPSNVLFGVLFAYFLLIATAGIHLRWLDKSRTPVLAALLLALTALIISSILRSYWRHADTEGFLDLARLMIVAKYGYPEMLGYAGIGMAMGLWISRSREDPLLARHAALAGLVLVELSLLLSITLGQSELWFAGGASSMTIIAYAGMILMMFGGMLWAVRAELFTGVMKVPGRILMMIGMLSFMAYVGHEVAMSLHGILHALGTHYGLSIALSVGSFLLLFGIAVRRLYRLYYGG